MDDKYMDDTEKTTKVTRFEVIDHRDCSDCFGTGLLSKPAKPCPKCGGSGSPGRVTVEYGVKVQLSYQDDGRTLKVFLSKPGKK